MTAWRHRCPEGHTNLQMGRDRAFCESCREPYDRDELVDLAGGASA